MKTNRIRLTLLAALVAVALLSLWSATKPPTPLATTLSAVPSEHGTQAANPSNTLVDDARAQLLAALASHGQGGAVVPAGPDTMLSELNPTRALEARFTSEEAATYERSG